MMITMITVLMYAHADFDCYGNCDYDDDASKRFTAISNPYLLFVLLL